MMSTLLKKNRYESPIEENRTLTLQLRSVNAGYGPLKILEDASLVLKAGEICCVLGEEGSGKSTLLAAITGLIPSTGTIFALGKDLRSIRRSQLVQHGLDFLPQGGSILPTLTVDEHLCLALSAKRHSPDSMYIQEVFDMFPQLEARRTIEAGSLSGGERIMLSLACLLRTDATLWLLDEPTAGLAPEMCQRVAECLVAARERGKSILLLEHNYEFALQISDQAFVLKDQKLSRSFEKREFSSTIKFIEGQIYNIDSKTEETTCQY